MAQGARGPAPRSRARRRHRDDVDQRALSRPGAAGARRRVASERWPTASPRRPAPTSSSTGTTRSTGIPWGPEALELARAEDRPILLSIGYSSCHWCHVMERESFEDAETAAFMNEHFVPVKVDREERPDVDAIYMEAVQGMTGHGGWPLTAFCDPDGVPVLRRHLLPARAAPGHAELPDGDGGGRRVVGLPARADPRVGRPDPHAARRRRRGSSPPDEPLGPEHARRRGPQAADGGRHAQRRLRRRAQVPARFGARVPARARRARRSSRRRSTGWPAAGSTTSSAAASPATRSTPVWLVPHFEKMLYDNALLARAYLHGWQAHGPRALARGLRAHPRLGAARDARPGGRVLLGARRRLRGRGGALLRLDAGRSWPPRSPTPASATSAEPILALLGRDRGRQLRGRGTSSTCRCGPQASAAGGPASAPARRCTRCARGGSGPGSTTSGVLSWNALMIAALADAGAALGRADYLDAASGCAEFIWERDARRRRPAAAYLEGRRGDV